MQVISNFIDEITDVAIATSVVYIDLHIHKYY